MAVLFTPPYQQFLDNNGVPLANGFVYTYAAGTTTPQATYTDASGTTALPNPVPLDSAGRATIWVSGTYKTTVTSADGSFSKTTDNIPSYAAQYAAAAAFSNTFSGNGSQTVFTLSQNLGTDKNTLLVFVNGLAVNPAGLTLNGTSLTFSAAPASGTNNVLVTAPSTLAGAAAVSAQAAAASATAAGTAATAALAAFRGPSLTTYGGVGNDSTNNDTAINAAIADSAYRYCFVPEGVFRTTLTTAQMAGKHFTGPGKFRNAAGTLAWPGNFDYVSTTPAYGPLPNNIELRDSFNGDISNIDAQYYVLGPNARPKFELNYFRANEIPNVQYMENRADAGGYYGLLTAASGIGATTVTINTVAGLTVGQQIILQTAGGTYGSPLTISAINAGTKVVTFTPALATAFAVGDYVATSIPHGTYQNLSELHNYGNGAGYVNFWRVTADATPGPGINHAFEVSCSSIWGSDTSANGNYQYLQTSETIISDNNFDCYTIGEVKNFRRNNNTGANNCEWFGMSLYGSGSVPCESAIQIKGLWKNGIDFSFADMTSNGGATIQMKSGQGIYFNASNNQTTNPIPAWGNVRGDTRQYYDSTNTKMVWDVGGSIGAMSLTSGGNLYLNGSLVSGQSISLPAGGKIIGDFSNSTLANRTAIQTSVVNASTSVPYLPNGTGTNSGTNYFSTSDPTNSSLGQVIMVGGQEFRINSAVTGTGTALPLSLNTAAGKVGQFTVAGSAAIGQASRPTNATAGFSYLPTTNGTPTGTPETITGFAPMQFDTSTNKLWIYNGTWKSVTLA